MAKKWGFDYNLWSSVEAGDAEARVYFETWNAKIKAMVPKDRLLIYNVKEGWEPLAKFLNVTTPATDAPFPRINDADTVRIVVKGGYWILVLAIPMTFLLCTCKIRRRLLERSLIKTMTLCKYYTNQDFKYKSVQAAKQPTV